MSHPVACIYKGYLYMAHEFPKGIPANAVPLFAAEPAREPSAMRQCRSCDGTGERWTGIDEAPTTICKPCDGTGTIAIAAQPAPRPWVGLTEDERLEIYNRMDWVIDFNWEYEQAIESKLRERNT